MEWTRVVNEWPRLQVPAIYPEGKKTWLSFEACSSIKRIIVIGVVHGAR
jgi:hypothetical protein